MFECSLEEAKTRTKRLKRKLGTVAEWLVGDFITEVQIQTLQNCLGELMLLAEVEQSFINNMARIEAETNGRHNNILT